jgi:hypothetical protein
MLNDAGSVVRVTHGPAPLWGPRRGEDVMMSNVLGFDLRVYDPGAPLYGRRDIPNNSNSPMTVLQPSDPGWRHAYNSVMGTFQSDFLFVGQGAYVDMGYTFGAPSPTVATGASWAVPWFAEARGLSDVFGNLLSPGYSVYDTWSFHYENNGVDEDADGTIDQGTNEFDGLGRYRDPAPPYTIVSEIRLGPDDVGERETVPPYDKPLRGMQVLIRSYEPDSRAIRQVRVNQHFMPE